MSNTAAAPTMDNVAAVRVLPVSVTMSDAFSARTVPAFDVPVAAVPAVAVTPASDWKERRK